MPPPAETWYTPVPGRGTNKMTSCWFQVPPRAPAASASVWICPVARSIFLSLPWAKNPTDWLFGDQKGKEASSVFASGSAGVAPSSPRA
jgi:hypothetical protein